MVKLYRIKVYTFFQSVQKDLDQWALKDYYDVEVSNSNTVADLQTRLFELANISGSAYFADFYREGFYVGGKLKAGDKIDDDATVYAVISCKTKVSKVVDYINRKDTHDRFSEAFSKDK